MTHAVLDFYHHAADNKAVALSPEMQAAILRLVAAQPGGCEDLLVALAGRTDLHPDTDAALRSTSSARVKATWLSRPGRSLEELKAALSAEKRATVLAAVAESKEASPELLCALARDKRASVASAVLHNAASPISAQVDAVLALEPRTLNWNQQSLLSRTLVNVVTSADATELNRLAQSCETPVVAAELLQSRVLDPSALGRVVAVALIDPLTSIDPNAPHYSSLTRIYEACQRFSLLMDNPSSTPELIRAVADVLHPLSKRLPAHYQRNQERVLRRLRELAGTEEERNVALEAARERQQMIEDAASASDTTRLDELVETACDLQGTARVQHDTELIDALLTNPALSDSQLAALVPVIHPRRLPTLVNSRPSLELVTAAFLGSTYSLDAIEGALTSLLETSDPRTLCAHLLSAAETRDDYQRERLVLQLLNSDLFPPELIGLAPWKVISNAVLDARAAARVNDRLNAGLGSNTPAWETFAVLGADFSGSLDDLISVAVLMA